MRSLHRTQHGVRPQTNASVCSSKRGHTVIRALLFSALVLLSGCVSYSEMQSRVPALEFDSAKAPDVYAGCVAPKLMEIWPGLVTIIPDGQSTVVTVASPGGDAITATLTIEPIATGSHVLLREMPHINVGSAFKRAQTAVHSCK